MMTPWVQTLSLLIESAAFILLTAMLLNARRKKHHYKQTLAQLNEWLSSAPDGWFCFAPNGEICSRRLAVLLGLIEPEPRFDDVLARLTPQSAAELSKAVKQLRRSGQEIRLVVKDKNEAFRLNVIGVRAESLEGELFGDLLWFQNETEVAAPLETLEKRLQVLEERDALFCEALDGLPFPLWLRNQDLTLAYCNTAYVRQAGCHTRAEALKHHAELVYESPVGMNPKILAISAKSSGETKTDRGQIMQEGRPQAVDFFEVPLYRDKPGEERYTIGFLRPAQAEETLRQTLDTYLKAQYQVLGSLASGIAIFDVNGYLQFFNKAFAAIWRLDEDWLSRHPSLAGILDKLREKRLLPEEAHFLQYKHSELQLFQTVTQPTESILHLPDGKILKRLMSPYPLGGMVMTFEDVTDRVSLERSFNEQIEIQKSIINHLPEAMIVFNADGRLRLYNTAYALLFAPQTDLAASEPLMADVLESQRAVLAQSDDVWRLLKQKILAVVETRDGVLTMQLADKSLLTLRAAGLPDGGMLLRYERSI